MTDKEKEAEIEQLRATINKDTEIIVKKQRFALFSQPPPLGLGDDSYSKKELHPRDENGKPVTEPTNVKVAGPKSGRIKSSYFQVQGYTTIGDQYMDPYRRDLQYEMEKKKRGQKNLDQPPFRPASGYKEVIVPAYPHLADFDAKRTRNYKGPDGRVQSAPRNVTTNPKCNDVFKFTKFMKDEYQRKHDHDLALFKAAKAKEKEVPFKSMVHGLENFNKDRQVYGLEGELPPPTKPLNVKLNILKHEVPFKPANPPKQGVKGQFEQIKYVPDPMKIKKRVDVPKGKDEFKPNNLGNLSRPTPTISCFKTNIRREMSAKGY